MFSAAFLLCPHSHQKLGPNPDRSTILVKYCRRSQPGNALGGLEQKQQELFAADLCAHAASRGRMFSWNLISVSILQEKQLYFWTFGSWNQQPPDKIVKTTAVQARQQRRRQYRQHTHPAEPEICTPAFIPSLKQYQNTQKYFHWVLVQQGDQKYTYLPTAKWWFHQMESFMDERANLQQIFSQ